MTSALTTTPATARRSRLRGLDGLRFLAAAVVVGYHYTGIDRDYWGRPPSAVFPTLNHVTRYGYLGVELFFVISGFVILMTAWGRPLPGFVASRVARLYPAYWVAVGLTVLLQLVWAGGRQLGWFDNAMNLTMVQEGFGIDSVQGAFWTLWVELKFYLLAALVLLVGFTPRRVLAFAILWPVLSQTFRLAGWTFLENLFIAEFAPYFGVGMLLFLIHREGGTLLRWLGVAVTGLLCVEQTVRHAPLATRGVGVEISPVACAVVVVAMIASVWLVADGPLRHLDWRWLSVVGALTYPLYLVHGQFGFAVIDTLHGRLGAYAVVALAVGLSLGIAVGLHYLVERRWHDRLRDGVLRLLGG
ncbi:acyltransferase family protein [Nocardioides jiangxiensis]|uniref:Acyltransferase n=1 Tax=Nocardioides jiangxiensis TaxID=3064524 RepID=A0ABT9AYC7_9ACTN|nr:acyltransferase [Nocardioides sp. WY-20]MDO7867338.1 acyltransferase [Nocardioides sp. WY-20]